MNTDLIVVYAVSERELSSHTCAGCRQDLLKCMVVQLPPMPAFENDTAKRKRKTRPQRLHLTCVASKWRACDQRTPPEAAFDVSALDARFPHVLTVAALPGADPAAHLTRWPLSFDFVDADVGAGVPLAAPVPASASAWIWLPETQAQ
jgi:hypothetical protein